MAAADVAMPAAVDILSKSDVSASNALSTTLAGPSANGPDMYTRMKALQRQLEFLQIQ